MRRAFIFGFFFCLLLLSGIVGFASRRVTPGRSQAQPVLQLSQAAYRHDIILLLIKKGEFDAVLPETRRLLAIKFAPKDEGKLTDSLVVIADALAHQRRADLAQQVLDEGLKVVTLSKSKAELYKRKAFFFKKVGKEDDAIRFFKMALDAEKQ